MTTDTIFSHFLLQRFHEADVPGRDPGERRLVLRQLLRRFVDVCNAVAYAHSRGVLHRDLKPAVALVMVISPQSAAPPPEAAAILRNHPRRGRLF